jgi:hypothetical protein
MGSISPAGEPQGTNFPTTPGAFQTAPPTYSVLSTPAFGFLMKLNAAGSIVRGCRRRPSDVKYLRHGLA